MAGLSVEVLRSLRIETPTRLMVVAISRLGNVTNSFLAARPVLPTNDATQRISCKFNLIIEITAAATAAVVSVFAPFGSGVRTRWQCLVNVLGELTFESLKQRSLERSSVDGNV